MTDSTDAAHDVLTAREAGLLERLAAMWEQLDPPPSDLATRSVFAVQLERLDAELLTLRDDVLELAGARSSEPVRTLRFSGEEVAILVMITVGPEQRSPAASVRIDGWVRPAHTGTVELRRDGRDLSRQRVDAQGRFAFPSVEATLAQLVFRPGGPQSQGTVACPPIRL